MSRRFTVYVTKYALTRGIEERLVEDCFDTSEGMVKDTALFAYYHGVEWHTTREAAVKQAKKMRLAKIRSLEKNLAKFKAMKFE